jgi:hypothetical protein
MATNTGGNNQKNPINSTNSGIFSIIKYSIPDEMLTLINIIYIGTLLAVQITINSSLAKTICDNPQSTTSGIVATIFPMLFIFGLLQLLLTIFPGWLEPFSNTFGYAIAKIGGAESVVREVLKTNSEREISKAVNKLLFTQFIIKVHRNRF